ncbi:MAG: histidine kinase [Saprospiraceae bacterium]|nr:histidine kinase [Saprospiraceae bacterium]
MLKPILILTILCLSQIVLGQNAPSKLDLLKSSLDTVPEKNQGKVYFKIAREYLEFSPDADSFMVYMNHVKAHTDNYEDNDLLYDYHYYMGTRLYRYAKYEEAAEHLKFASELSAFSNDSLNLARMYYANGIIQNQLGNEDAFHENLFKALAIGDALKHRTLQVTVLVALSIQSGRKKLIDKQDALLKQAFEFVDEVSTRTKINLITELVQVKLNLYERDSLDTDLKTAQKLIKQGVALADSIGNKLVLANLKTKDLFIKNFNGDDPESYFRLGDTIESLGIELDDPYFLLVGSLAKAESLIKLKRFKEALLLKQSLLTKAEKVNDKAYLRDVYKILSVAYYETGQYKSAYEFNDKYQIYNDSILSLEKAMAYAEVVEKYESEKKSKEILELTTVKENLELAAELKDSKLKQQFLFFGFLLVLLAAIGMIIYYWQRRRLINEQFKNAINEQKLLRSQMNPHFLFNALNSIKRFYVDGRTEEANDFLSDFSLLLRKILDQSSKVSVPIKEELEFLKLYLELEKLRLNKKMSFEINFNPSDFNYDDNIPSLILQPLVENSIWHGILKSDRAGKIEVSVTKEDGKIRCVVQDNGIGYHGVADSKNHKHQSKGLKLIRERIKEIGSFNIEQIYDRMGNSMGTKAELIIN